MNLDESKTTLADLLRMASEAGDGAFHLELTDPPAGPQPEQFIASVFIVRDAALAARLREFISKEWERA